MKSSSNSRRQYHSPRRQEQARLTRRAILDAALPLFVERGYAGTSLADIAEAAGVALKTVQAIFGTKAKLLSALWDVTVMGDDAAIPVAEREWFREMMEEPDARRQLDLHVRNAGQIKRRVGALMEVIRRASQGDSELGELWQVMQDRFLENQRMVAESLAAKGALRGGLDVAAAAEMIWTLNHPSVYYLLVYERGWSEERYERWLADVLIQQLLN
jgi:AcrR family transcriptional regulator